MLDFHTHILPKMDDGAKSIDISMNMIEMLVNNDITTVVASPHFYLEHSDIDSFLKRRQESYDLLLEEITKRNTVSPNILLGAEVHLSPSLSKLDDLPKLCIEGSKYLLVEMPYTIWNEQMFEELYTIIAKFDVTIVLAHIERYISIQGNIEKIYSILGLDVLAQMNVNSFTDSFFKKNLKNILSFENIKFLGSDCHDDKIRIPNMKKAEKHITKMLGLERYLDLTKDIFKGE